MTMLALLVTLATAPLQSGSTALHVRSSVAFAPCLVPVVEAYRRESGRAAVLDIGLPDPAGDADVVIGEDSEMTRLLEGGTAKLTTAIDLGSVPWVFVDRQGSSFTAFSNDSGTVAVLGGIAGREARSLLSRMGETRPQVLTDAQDLGRARNALVPRSLAGAGDHRPADVAPLMATAAEIRASRHGESARGFLAFLASTRARAMVDGCFRGGAAAPATTFVVGAEVYGRTVTDWWLPQCSLTRNGHNDPQQSLGRPDAVRLEPDRYLGLISLGQGGYVTLELSEPAADGPGADIRIFQTTSNEPVTVYASSASQGPFVLLGLRRTCGTRTQGVFSNHCDFDLRDGGLTTARYVKIEDGEIYPCLAAGTLTEGADLDAVQVLNR
jgi:hypothetical protein